jgi:hypothetical protein
MVVSVSEINEGPACNCTRKCYYNIKVEDIKKTTDTFYSLSDFTSQRLSTSNHVTASEPGMQYTKTSQERMGKEHSPIKLLQGAVKLCFS